MQHSKNLDTSPTCATSLMAEEDPENGTYRSKEALLEVFFYGIGQFMFEAAKEIIEKEKEGTKVVGTLWFQLCSVLCEFVNAEKLYFTLTYIEKRVLRRDVVRPLYDKIHNDLRKFESVGEAASSDIIDLLSSDLAKQLSKFVTARKEMIDFYAKMAKSRWDNKECDEQLVKLMENIIERHKNQFHHPILDVLKTSFSLEVDIVQDLFKAELEMQHWNYFQSMLLLFQCQTNLNAWTQLPLLSSVRELASQAPAKSPLSMMISRKNWHPPFLYQWLYQKNLAVISKFSLYFYTTLSSQTTPNEMKMMTGKTSIDYFAKITTFIRKTDAQCVCLVLDANFSRYVSPGHGYFLPNIEHEKPTGLDTYPAIVSFLEPLSSAYWPNVVSLLNDKTNELSHPGRIAYYYEPKMNLSHYLIKVDVQIYLLIVFNGKKKEKDSYVQKFLTEMRSLLCYERQYQMLKPRQVQKFRK